MDELKRQELERLRNLAKMARDTTQDDSPHLRPPEHLDHANPNSFEIADLHKLIRKVNIMICILVLSTMYYYKFIKYKLY